MGTFWPSIRPIELSADVEKTAGQLATTHMPRSAAAVHLASALAIGSANVTVAVWDKRLHAGAIAAGLAAAPATFG